MIGTSEILRLFWKMLTVYSVDVEDSEDVVDDMEDIDGLGF